MNQGNVNILNTTTGSPCIKGMQPTIQSSEPNSLGAAKIKLDLLETSNFQPPEKHKSYPL